MLSPSGAGLTGLTFAHALKRFAPDVRFAIYEGAARLDAIGAGIGMQPRSWSIMRAIGLTDALLKIAGDWTNKSERARVGMCAGWPGTR